MLNGFRASHQVREHIAAYCAKRFEGVVAEATICCPRHRWVITESIRFDDQAMAVWKNYA